MKRILRFTFAIAALVLVSCGGGGVYVSGALIGGDNVPRAAVWKNGEELFTLTQPQGEGALILSVFVK